MTECHRLKAVIDQQKGTETRASEDNLGHSLSLIGPQQAAPCIYRGIACYYYQGLSMRVDCHSYWRYTWFMRNMGLEGLRYEKI